jgi:hypothetical protein
VLELGDDPLFPQARDHTAPRRRRRPLAIDVRSVQDISQFATETGRMARLNGILSLGVPDEVVHANVDWARDVPETMASSICTRRTHEKGTLR